MRDTRLICLEGIAGSGKTTTARRLSETLRAAGIDHTLYPEMENPYRIGGELTPDGLEDFVARLLVNWELLCEEVDARGTPCILDGFFLQQPNNYLVWYGAPRRDALKLVADIHELAAHLSPTVICYRQADIPRHVERTFARRDPKWVRDNLEPFEHSPFYQSLGATDPIQGIQTFFETVQSIHREVLGSVVNNYLIVDNDRYDYPAHEHRIRRFLQI